MMKTENVTILKFYGEVSESDISGLYCKNYCFKFSVFGRLSSIHYLETYKFYEGRI